MDKTQENKKATERRKCCFGGKILVVLVLLAVYYCFGITKPTSGDFGLSLNDESLAAKKINADDSFKVGTFNIRRFKGTDEKKDMDRTLDVLQGLDFIGLNEVGGTTFLDKQTQAQLLAEELSMGWMFAPTEHVWLHDNFGNAFLSKLPIVSWQRIPLTVKPNLAIRNAVLVKLQHPNGIINVIVTHVANERDNPEQFVAVSELFMSLQEPAILMGDFNHTIDVPEVQALLERPGVKTAVEAGYAVDGRKLIDWIFYRGLDCLGSEVIPPLASDHPTIRAEFVWPSDEIETD
jgi:endonuclease/exonuclease/phosphatase family metal-dependent hydrolase